MRKFIVLPFFLCTTIAISASECTDYLTNLYKQEQNIGIKIVSKTEHIDKYEQSVGDFHISSIVYGTGFLKCPKHKKSRITYITLLDNDSKPIWGYVIPR